jgi:hypothetical protein
MGSWEVQSIQGVEIEEGYPINALDTYLGAGPESAGRLTRTPAEMYDKA